MRHTLLTLSLLLHLRTVQSLAAGAVHVRGSPQPLLPGRRCYGITMGEEEPDDIATLEARLAELKEKKKAEEELAEAGNVGTRKVEMPEGFDVTTLSNRKKVLFSTQESQAPIELLSESWKEQDPAEAAEGESGGINLVGIAVAAVLFVVFAQISTPNEIDPITYGTSTVQVETPDQIRERFGYTKDDSVFTEE